MTPSPCWLKMWAIISGIYQKDVLIHNLCDFMAILLMDIVLTLPKFAKKFMITQIIQRWYCYWKLNILIFLKGQHSETKKQNSVILLKCKVYSLLEIASEFSMIGVRDFIDETGGMTRPLVSTSSSSIHCNFSNWNAHSSSFCRRAATYCGLRCGGWTVSVDCLLGGSEGI